MQDKFFNLLLKTSVPTYIHVYMYICVINQAEFALN